MAENFERRLAESRAREYEEYVNSGKCKSKEIIELQKQMKTPGISTEALSALIRKANLIKVSKSSGRTRGTFNLLKNAGPNYKPKNRNVYQHAIRLKKDKQVSVVIAYYLNLKENDVDLMLQYAVKAGDLTEEEYYAKLPTTCSKEDVLEAQEMLKEGIQTGDIVVAFHLRNVRISKEIIAHPENYV